MLLVEIIAQKHEDMRREGGKDEGAKGKIT